MAFALVGSFPAGSFSPAAYAGAVIIPDNYHYQVTQNFCAAASVEMMLDCPQVLNSNPTLATLIAQGDGPTVAFVPPGTQPIPALEPVATTAFGNVTSGGPQAFIYGLNHGNNTVNGMGYSNIYSPFGVGTDNLGMVTALNLLDNPNDNAGVPNMQLGSDQYAGYNTTPTYNLAGNLSLVGVTNATRTMADAMASTNIAAQATINNGSHAICVYGVTTAGGQPGFDANYTITGVLVHDPWTGYVVQRQQAGQFGGPGGLLPTNQAWGLGFNTWLRYGYDNPSLAGTGGTAFILPNGNVQNIVTRGWLNYFNISGPQPVFGNFSGTNAGNVFANAGLNQNVTNFYSYGYKFTVEPQGPQSLDTGDPALDGSLPAPPPLITEENAGQADTSAISDLAANSTLNSEPGLTGGSLDSGHEMLMQMPGDISGQGDWLVPYDGSGGINDVTGALMIDADTGVIDEATWIDPTDGISSFSLAQLDQMFMDEANGNVDPSDNAVPEPGTNALLAVAGIGLLGYFGWRRKTLGKMSPLYCRTAHK